MKTVKTVKTVFAGLLGFVASIGPAEPRVPAARPEGADSPPASLEPLAFTPRNPSTGGILEVA